MWISIYPVLWWSAIASGALLLAILIFRLTQPLRTHPRLHRIFRVEISWEVVKVAAAAAVLILTMQLLTRYLSARQLRARVLVLSSEITTFADERNRLIPQPENRPDWVEYTHRLSRFSQETLDLYAQRYGERVLFVRKELARRGLTDEGIEKFYDRPATPLAVRTVGERLAFLANQLP